MPLVERGNGDKIGSRLQRRTQRGFVVFAVDAISSVFEVPWSNACVNVSWAHTRNEYEVVIVTEGFDRDPVALSGAVCETVGSEVGVEAIEPCSKDLSLMFLFN